MRKMKGKKRLCPLCQGTLTTKKTLTEDFIEVECGNTIEYMDSRNQKKNKQCKYINFIKVD